MRKRGLFSAAMLVAALFWNATAASAASAPSDVHIAVYVDFSTGGQWSSAGAFTDSGQVGPVSQRFASPRPPSPEWTAHEELLYVGSAGTFTVQQQVLLLDVSPIRSQGTAHWIVLSGTGAYAGLRGHGTGSIAIDWQAGTLTLDIVGQVQ